MYKLLKFLLILGCMAGAATLFAKEAGGSARAASSKDTTATPAMNHYALLLYEDAHYRSPRPEEQADRVKEYTSWLHGLADGVTAVDGAEIDLGTSIVVSERGESGTVTSNLGVLAGYFVVAAQSEHLVVAAARNSPHVRYGGTVHVRRIVN